MPSSRRSAPTSLIPLTRSRFPIGGAATRIQRLLSVAGAVVVSAIAGVQVAASVEGKVWDCTEGLARDGTSLRFDAVSFSYLRWTEDHPGQICPRSMAEILPYGDSEAGTDGWGRAMALMCGEPVQGVRAVSAGHDGLFGTEDDQWSEDLRPRRHDPKPI
jgi:hypothetical protein